VRVLDGRTFAQIDPIAQAAALDSANRNDFPPGGSRQLLVELGVWNDTARTFTPSAGAPTSRPNAARVTATDTVSFLFNSSGRTTSRSAIAMQQPTLDFSVGSIAAGLQPNQPVPPNITTILNQALGQQLSQNLNLNLVSYQGLASSTIGLQDLAAELGLGSADDLLTTRVSLRSVLEASVAVLNSQGDQASLAAATTLQPIADMAPPNKTVGPLVVQCTTVQGVQTCQSFSDPDRTVIVDNTPGHVADVRMSVQQLLLGMNASGDVIDGHNLLSFDLAPSALGFPTGAIDSIHVNAAFIEPAQEVSGPIGTTASTGQVRFSVEVKLHSTLDLVGGVSLPISVTLPFVFDLAHADATVTRIACYDPDVQTASQSDIAVTTSAADFYLGDITNQNLKTQTDPLTIPTGTVLPADIVVIAGVAPMTGFGHLSLGGGSDVLYFQGPYGPTNTQRAQGGFDTSGVNSLTDKVLSQLILDHSGLDVAIPSITPPGLNPSVDPVVQQLLSKDGALVALDQLLFAPLTQALGVSFGGADVTALGIGCDTPILVK